MNASSFFPSLPTLARLSRQTAAPFQILARTTGYRLRPPAAREFVPGATSRQHPLLASGVVGPQQRAEIRVEERSGPLPTIVVGGFVPDATEAFYLLRGGLLRHGSVFYLNYPRRGFSTDLFLAQLEDLIEEIAVHRGQRPALIAVSFGAGLVLELLRRAALRGAELPLAGLTLVSPVACVADLIDLSAPKPTTLLGRVILPYLRGNAGPDGATVEKSRSVFLRMFESGAQNQNAFRFLLTRAETRRLRDAVVGSINAIDAAGAFERVQALNQLPAPDAPRVLFRGPSLVLYAEKESAVLQEHGPTWRELSQRTTAWLPQGRCVVVTNSEDNPVQHASLIFHSRNFEPHLAQLYRRIRQQAVRAA